MSPSIENLLDQSTKDADEKAYDYINTAGEECKLTPKEIKQLRALRAWKVDISMYLTTVTTKAHGNIHESTILELLYRKYGIEPKIVRELFEGENDTVTILNAMNFATFPKKPKEK